MSTFVNKPVSNLKQKFNDSEKKQARDNIDAVSSKDIEDIIEEKLNNHGLIYDKGVVYFG